MGFRKPIEAADVISQIRRASAEINSSYNDGFTCWEIKQDLYQIKFFLDEVLQNASKFSGEEAWLEEQSKKKVWNTLKK